MSSLLGGATPTQVATGEIFFEEGKWPIDHVEVLISHLIRACRRQEKNHGPNSLGILARIVNIQGQNHSFPTDFSYDVNMPIITIIT